MAGPVYNPGEPYMLQIPGGFSPGRIAHVTGTFKPTATSFILKFQSGPVGDPTDEIGLCMYGRVAEGVIGRNSFTRASGWGQEEASNSIALARGQNFEVTILCDPMVFKIALNGQHFAEYNHRTNPATMSCLNVASTSQDLTLACVWIEDSAPVQPPAQVPYSQASAGPYPPAPNYGPPPPYSGGPGFAPAYPDQSMYQHGAPPGQYGAPQYSQHGSGSGSNKGLMGMVAGAGAAVAGALGASHLIGKSKSSHGYPGYGGYPSHGGYPGHGSGGGGGILGKAMQVGGALATAKMASKPSKALKYGAPLAGLGALGAGGYMMHKGMGHGFHCGGSSSSGSSEEE